MFADMGSPFTWIMYAIVLVGYSFVALKLSWNGNKSPIFSARNVKPRRDIFLIHAAFLGALFNILLLMARFFPVHGERSSFWLTITIYKGFTPLDCALMAICYVVALVERRLIYVDGKTGKTDLPGDLDYY